MRRRVPAKYFVLVNGSGGAVIAYDRNGKTEFLGRDGLWHRKPEHCDPMDRGLAELRVNQLQEADHANHLR